MILLMQLNNIITNTLDPLCNISLVNPGMSKQESVSNHLGLKTLEKKVVTQPFKAVGEFLKGVKRKPYSKIANTFTLHGITA